MAMARVRKRATAGRDLADHYVYLGEQAGIETAERFLFQADETFRDLAMHPSMGIELAVSRPELVGMRKVAGQGFREVPDLLFAPPEWRIDCVSAACCTGLVEPTWHCVSEINPMSDRIRLE